MKSKIQKNNVYIGVVEVPKELQYISYPDQTTEYALRAEPIKDEIQYLEGKILTIIDASIISESQNKSVKDLIKNNFSELISNIYQRCYNNNNIIN